MNDSKSTIPVRRADLILVLRHLEILVVSLDRIGSASAALSREEADRLTTAFLHDWHVFRRLANCRRVLSDYFSDALGEDDMDELEREVKDLPQWMWNARTPPDPGTDLE